MILLITVFAAKALAAKIAKASIRYNETHIKTAILPMPIRTVAKIGTI